MPRLRHVSSKRRLFGAEISSTVAAMLLLAASLAGCGGGGKTAGGSSSISSSQVVARVGGVTIDRGEVEHWASAVSRGNSVGTALGPTSGTPREKALEFLISCRWLLGEVEEQGLSISTSAVERGLQEKIDGLPNGRLEFQEELSSTGQTLADTELELRSTLAVAALRDAVAKRVPAVRGAEVASYYTHHRRSFYLPDRRVAYLIEGIRSYTHAVALAKQVRPGEHLTMPWFREVVPRTREADEPGKLAHMVFTATPGHVNGPTMFFGHWVLGIVKRLIPAGVQPLAVVRSKLSRTLYVERRERSLARFAAAYVRRWRARTWCSPGFVIENCSEYRGAHTAERNPLMGSE
jgi:hypothetical protein